MAENKNITASAPSEELRGRFESFVEERDLSNSQAAKRLIDKGLREEGYLPANQSGSDILLFYVNRMGMTMFLGGLVAIAVGAFTTYGLRFAGLAILSLGALLSLTAWGLDQMEPTLGRLVGSSSGQATDADMANE